MSTGRATEARAADVPADDVLAFLELLWALAHGMDTVSKHMHATLGITGPQRVVIRTIGRFAGLTAGEIADRAHHHPSTLSGILKRLEEHGHIVRVTDPSDHRRVRLLLSKSGQRLDARHEGTVEAAVRAALARVEPDQIEGARVVIRTLMEELERVVAPRRV